MITPTVLFAAGLLLIIWVVGGILVVSTAAHLAEVELPKWPGTELFPVMVGVLWPIALRCVYHMAVNRGVPAEQHDEPAPYEEPQGGSGRGRRP